MTNAQMIFDAGAGSIAEYGRLAAAATGGATLQWMLLQSGMQADATLQAYTTVAAVLGGSGNSEASFTGYSRKTLTAAHITVSVDTTNHDATVDCSDDPQWSPTTAQALGKIVLFFNPTGSSADSACIPLFADSFVITTPTSGTITYQIASGGFFKATH